MLRGSPGTLMSASLSGPLNLVSAKPAGLGKQLL